MLELDYKESWLLKNQRFWTVMLEKTPESPLDCKEIQPVHPKGDVSWVFIGRTDVEAETPTFWPSYGKNWLIGKHPDPGKDWGQEEKAMRWLDDITRSMEMSLSQFPGVVDGQGGLVCSGSWGCEESDTTEQLNWTESIFILFLYMVLANVLISSCCMQLSSFPSITYWTDFFFPLYILASFVVD